MNLHNIFASALLVAASSFPATVLVASTGAEELDAHLPPLMERTRVPAVAVAVIRDGKVASTRTYGERAPGMPADGDTVFNVASLTKPVFSMMALALVADGSMELDGPLSRYWVDPDIADDPRRHALTPRIVLSHQTGLQNWRGDGALAFSFDPGSRHEYSGEGFEYLRRAIERKSGRSLPGLMREHVLEPAGMDATFGWTDGLQAHLATGFDEDGEPIDMQHLRQRGPNAAASMFTTAADYGRFLAWVVEGGDLPDGLFRQMARPQARHDDPAEAFGLGWKLVGGDSKGVLWHDGREPGVRTLAIARPMRRDGLVVLTNGSNGELLMRPVVAAVLEDGEALMRQLDRDVWRYLQSLPGTQLGQVMQVISRSPSFTSKLLHAADTVLVQASPLEPAPKLAAAEAIGPLVLAMLDGDIDQQHVERLLSLLIESEDGDHRLRRRFDAQQAAAWAEALHVEGGSAATSEAGPNPALREVVEVPPHILAEYAGVYLVPSSQLRITVTVRDGLLVATAPETPATTFYPASERLFFMKESATDFEFARDDSGQVSGIRIIWDGSRSEFAERLR